MLLLRFIAGFTALLLSSCVTPRSSSLFGLQFSEQASRAIIDMTCNGVRGIHQGVAVCEEQSPRNAVLLVKIIPTPGRVVFSDGLVKKVVDFNWRKSGGWWWKKTILSDTWAPLDIGELNETFGEVPVAFDVTGVVDGVGVINNRGVVYHRICNDRDIPCSKLIVDYECGGKVKNTAAGQLGACNRMSNSPQRFRIPLKGIEYTLKSGAQVVVRSGRSTWSHSYTVTSADVARGDVRVTYPTVLNGPDLFQIEVFQWEQGVAQRYRTNILLVGFDPKWTGLDSPHWVRNGSEVEFCSAIESELTEIIEAGSSKRKLIKGRDCDGWDWPSDRQVCAWSWDRESGDLSYVCINKQGKEVRWGT